MPDYTRAMLLPRGSWPRRIAIIAGFDMGERQIHNLGELIDRWRLDALEFLHLHAPKVAVILIEAAVLIWLIGVISRRLKKFGESKALPSGIRAQQLKTLSGIVYSAGVFIIIFNALLQILPEFGIQIGPLLASAGVAGLAIGFGAQTLVKDVINGFFILMENQYEVGDVIRTGGITGTVENMTLRKTLVRDDQGALSTIPNSTIAVVANLTRDWAQVALHVTVAYTEKSDRIIELLTQVGQELRNDPQWSDVLVSDPQVPGIDKVNGNEVEYLLLVKTRPGTQYAVTRELRRRIKDYFDKNNIQTGGPGRMYVVDSGPQKP
jgi:small-conductance mechanosensitive channel